MERRSPEVLIVGGGAIGCAIAWKLAERGQRDILLIDRGWLGDGSSNKAAGGIRAQFSTEINIRFTQLSEDYFRHAPELLGADIGYDEAGYIFLARSAQQAETFRANVELQRSLGVDVDWLTPDDLERGWPYLHLDGVHAGTFGRTDAIFDQVRFMDALAARARDAGVTVREGVEVTGLRLRDGHVTGVDTVDGPIEAGTTILAAGVWSVPLGRTVGLDLPVAGLRREIYTVADVPGLPERMPFIADFDRGTYVRREQGGVGFRIAGMIAPSDNADPTLDLTPDRVREAIGWAAEVLPQLGEPRATGGWAGLTEITPDHHALLGPVPGMDGLIVATGFSGHGVMHAPATGLVIAELLLDGQATSIDISSLSPTRFQEGKALTETMFARSAPVPAHEQGDVVVREGNG
jgi:sarcosine oxidase subunit beta